MEAEIDRCFKCGTCTQCDLCFLICPDISVSERLPESNGLYGEERLLQGLRRLRHYLPDT